MASIWFVRGGGKVYGPLDSGKLKQLVSDGKIDQTTEIAQNQAGPWFAAGKVQGLFAASDATPRPLPMSAAIATSPNAKDKFVLPEAAPNGVGSNACQPNSARSFRHWYRQAVGCLSIPLQIITWLCRFFISLWLGKQVTKPESQTGDGAEGFILCPDCGANVVAPVQSALADNPEYKEAKNIHMGLHSWRVYLKKKAFLVLGFVTWYHDLIDGVVKNLCAQAGETVDSATQSFSWRWTIGWF